MNTRLIGSYSNIRKPLLLINSLVQDIKSSKFEMNAKKSEVTPEDAKTYLARNDLFQIFEVETERFCRSMLLCVILIVNVIGKYKLIDFEAVYKVVYESENIKNKENAKKPRDQ